MYHTNLLAEVSDVVKVQAGFDNSFAITGDGKVYSWGFSSNYQTGQGTIDDIEKPTLIDNTAIRGKKIIGAGAGGQYSLLVGIPDDAKANGVNGTH
jgi:regulator of chromosome condensation